MSLLLGCWLLQAAISSLVPQPWLVPDLTAVGLVGSIGARPSRWIVLSLVAGSLALPWAIRDGPLVLGQYVCAGALVRLLASYLNTADAWVQAGLVAALCTGLRVTELWADQAASWPLAGWTAVHVLLTAASMAVLRRVGPARMALGSRQR